MTKFKSTAVLPYVNGLFQQLCHSLQQQGVCTVFKSETVLRSHLVQPKDPANPTKMERRCLQNSLWMQQRDWKTHARQEKGAWQRYLALPYPDLRRLRPRSQHRTLFALRWGKVYWFTHYFLTWVLLPCWQVSALWWKCQAEYFLFRDTAY